MTCRVAVNTALDLIAIVVWVLSDHILGRVFVATGTGIGEQILWVAKLAALLDAGPVVERENVLLKLSRCPGLGRVAGGAAGPKLAAMQNRLLMAVGTVGALITKGAVEVTIPTG